MDTKVKFPFLGPSKAGAALVADHLSSLYEYPETREIVRLVEDASDMIHMKGAAALDALRVAGSRWQKGETYIFVLDPEGNMLVHPDYTLEGKNQMGLKDINGKPIVKGLLTAAMALPDKPQGWYHYQWPVPGGLLPRWKSSYVQRVVTPAGSQYIVGCGMYNDRMERAFVVDMVQHAVGLIERQGKAAFRQFYDPQGPFIAKDAYIFVTSMEGVEMVNPAFPNLEGRKLLDKADTGGKYVYRELIGMISKEEEGWMDYLWPKPGESVATLKSAYVHAAKMGDQKVMVGCGVYLADAPVEKRNIVQPNAAELTQLVREAAALLEERGEPVYETFRKKGSRWFHDDTYLFVFDMKGKRIFHAAEPESEGRDDHDLKDVLGRPIVRMILDTGSSPFGEGWAHYQYPEPGSLVPAWKSSFVKRATLPSGEKRIIGCGIYNMEMDKAFIADIVHQAAGLIAEKGPAVFQLLRDKKGPFVFMDTYVFVLSPDGTQLVNGGMPSLEGKNLANVKDLQGKKVILDEINAAMTEGSAWLEFYWYTPGDNTPALKQTFVRKVQFKGETFIVGSGLYGGEGPAGKTAFRKIVWNTLATEQLSDKLTRQVVHGEKATVASFVSKKGATAGRHFHANEEYAYALSGRIKFIFDDREVEIGPGEMMVVPPNVPHAMLSLEDSVFLDFFTPVREDWLRGEDAYLRK